MKFRLILSFALSILLPSMAFSSNEAILHELYENLDEDRVHPNIHLLSNEAFEGFFPSNIPPNLNVSWLEVNMPGGWCGAARRAHGSGVIINAVENAQDHTLWDIEGLTALHVLGRRSFEFRTFGFTGFKPHGLSTFTPGQYIDEDPLSKQLRLITAKHIINEVQIHPTLDICLFKGQCPKYIPLNADFPIVNRNSTDIEKKKVSIIHYPKGDPQQRINMGILDEGGQNYLFYRVQTLAGSSGSPILYNGEICGIHISADILSQNEFVSVDGTRYNVTNRNKGVFVNEEMIELLKARPVIAINQS